MRVNWRLVRVFGGVGAYFLARILGASVLGSIGIALIAWLVIYLAILIRRRGPRNPNAAA